MVLTEITSRSEVDEHSTFPPSHMGWFFISLCTIYSKKGLTHIFFGSSPKDVLAPAIKVC